MVNCPQKVKAYSLKPSYTFGHDPTIAHVLCRAQNASSEKLNFSIDQHTKYQKAD